MDNKGNILTLDRTKGSVARRPRRRLFLEAFGVAVLLLTAATIYLSLPAAASRPDSEVTAGLTADSARWAAIGDYYKSRARDIEQGVTASIARWEVMGKHYASRAANIEQGAEASVARWEAMGEYYVNGG